MTFSAAHQLGAKLRIGRQRDELVVALVFYDTLVRVGGEHDTGLSFSNVWMMMIVG